MSTDTERLRLADFFFVADDKVLRRLASDPKYVKTQSIILDMLDKASLFGDFRPEAHMELCRRIKDLLWDNVVCSHRMDGNSVYFFAEEVPQEVLDSNIFYTPNSTGLH